jgi:hypothetical protein
MNLKKYGWKLQWTILKYYPSLLQVEPKSIEPQKTNQGSRQKTEPETPRMQSRGADARLQFSIMNRETALDPAFKYNPPTKIATVFWVVT